MPESWETLDSLWRARESPVDVTAARGATPLFDPYEGKKPLVRFEDEDVVAAIERYMSAPETRPGLLLNWGRNLYEQVSAFANLPIVALKAIFRDKEQEEAFASQYRGELLAEAGRRGYGPTATPREGPELSAGIDWESIPPGEQLEIRNAADWNFAKKALLLDRAGELLTTRPDRTLGRWWREGPAEVALDAISMWPVFAASKMVGGLASGLGPRTGVLGRIQESGPLMAGLRAGAGLVGRGARAANRFAAGLNKELHPLLPETGLSPFTGRYRAAITESVPDFMTRQQMARKPVEPVVREGVVDAVRGPIRMTYDFAGGGPTQLRTRQMLADAAHAATKKFVEQPSGVPATPFGLYTPRALAEAALEAPRGGIRGWLDAIRRRQRFPRNTPEEAAALQAELEATGAYWEPGLRTPPLRIGEIGPRGIRRDIEAVRRAQQEITQHEIGVGRIASEREAWGPAARAAGKAKYGEQITPEIVEATRPFVNRDPAFLHHEFYPERTPTSLAHRGTRPGSYRQRKGAQLEAPDVNVLLVTGNIGRLQKQVSDIVIRDVVERTGKVLPEGVKPRPGYVDIMEGEILPSRIESMFGGQGVQIPKGQFEELRSLLGLRAPQTRIKGAVRGALAKSADFYRVAQLGLNPRWMGFNLAGNVYGAIMAGVRPSDFAKAARSAKRGYKDLPGSIREDIIHGFGRGVETLGKREGFPTPGAFRSGLSKTYPQRASDLFGAALRYTGTPLRKANVAQEAFFRAAGAHSAMRQGLRGQGVLDYVNLFWGDYRSPPMAVRSARSAFLYPTFQWNMGNLLLKYPFRYPGKFARRIGMAESVEGLVGEKKEPWLRPWENALVPLDRERGLYWTHGSIMPLLQLPGLGEGDLGVKSVAGDVVTLMRPEAQIGMEWATGRNPFTRRDVSGQPWYQSFGQFNLPRQIERAAQIRSGEMEDFGGFVPTEGGRTRYTTLKGGATGYEGARVPAQITPPWVAGLQLGGAALTMRNLPISGSYRLADWAATVRKEADYLRSELQRVEFGGQAPIEYNGETLSVSEAEAKLEDLMRWSGALTGASQTAEAAGMEQYIRQYRPYLEGKLPFGLHLRRGQ